MPRTERPLEPDDGPLTEFAAQLRMLRKEAGSPPYRQLARRAHFSSSTLSDAAGGRRLPGLDITLAYVRACGGDEEVWRSRWHEVAAELARSEPAAEPVVVHDEGAPYVGLAAFRTEDAALFFGREAMVDKLLTRLTTQRFVAVFGASGEGKSSLLSAGLIPGFTGDEDSGGPRPHLVFTPGPHPVEELGIRLAGLVDRTPGQLHTDLAADRRNLHRLTRHHLLDALLSQLVADAASRVGTLPLVSHALLETWRRRRGNTLTLVGYQAAGGIRSALAQTAEAVYASLSTPKQRLVQQLL